jgi:hypothetical protein
MIEKKYNKLTAELKSKIAVLTLRFRLYIVEKFNIKTSNLIDTINKIRYIKLEILIGEYRDRLVEKYAGI